MGHRGLDVEAMGFGVGILTNLDGTFKFEWHPKYPVMIDPKNLPRIPSSLPANVSAANIISTLGLK